MRLSHNRVFAALAATATATLALGLTGRPAAMAAEGDPASEKPTVMTVRGKELFRDSLGQPLAKGWVAAKGDWKVVDGAIQGTERPADQHAAAARHALK